MISFQIEPTRRSIYALQLARILASTQRNDLIQFIKGYVNIFARHAARYDDAGPHCVFLTCVSLVARLTACLSGGLSGLISPAATVMLPTNLRSHLLRPDIPYLENRSNRHPLPDTHFQRGAQSSFLDLSIFHYLIDSTIVAAPANR